MIMAADIFYWSRLTLIYLTGITVFCLILRPKKEIAKPALIAGAIMSVANFIIEASAKVLGVWMYQGGDLFFILGIPFNVLFHFTIAGFAIALLDEEIIRRFGSRFSPRNLTIAIILAISAVSALGDFGYESDGIIYFSPWWTPGHIFFVWLFLYTLDLYSFKYLKKRM